MLYVDRAATLKTWTAAGFYRLLKCWLDGELDNYRSYNDSFVGTTTQKEILSRSNDSIGVYILYFALTGEYYIGSSKIMYVRTKNHFAALRARNHSNSKMNKAYGRNRSNLPEVLYISTNHEPTARSVEQRLIDLVFHELRCLNLRAMVEEYRPATEETSAKIREHAKKRWSDPTFRAKMNAVFKTPEFIRKKVESNKRRFADPLEKQKYAEKTRQRWQDPEYVEARRASGVKRWETPDAREKHKSVMAAMWGDPELKAKLKAKMIEGNAKRARPVVVNGIRYRHAVQAGLELGIGENTVRRRCDSTEPVFADWTYE